MLLRQDKGSAGFALGIELERLLQAFFRRFSRINRAAGIFVNRLGVFSDSAIAPSSAQTFGTCRWQFKEAWTRPVSSGDLFGDLGQRCISHHDPGTELCVIEKANTADGRRNKGGRRLSAKADALLTTMIAGELTSWLTLPFACETGQQSTQFNSSTQLTGAADQYFGHTGTAHSRSLCFLSSFTVLACGPFSPISSAKMTCVPTASRLNAPWSTLLR